MQMAEGEIRRIYKAARNIKKQISILADLNRCSTGVILEIIHGRKEIAELENLQAPVEMERLMCRLDELDALIKPLEEEYRRTAAALMETGGRDAGRSTAGD